MLIALGQSLQILSNIAQHGTYPRCLNQLSRCQRLLYSVMNIQFYATTKSTIWTVWVTGYVSPFENQPTGLGFVHTTSHLLRSL